MTPDTLTCIHIQSSDYNKPSILANLIHSAEQQREAQRATQSISGGLAAASLSAVTAAGGGAASAGGGAASAAGGAASAGGGAGGESHSQIVVTSLHSNRSTANRDNTSSAISGNYTCVIYCQC